MNEKQCLDLVTHSLLFNTVTRNRHPSFLQTKTLLKILVAIPCHRIKTLISASQVLPTLPKLLK